MMRTANRVPTPDGKVYLLDGAKHAFCVYMPEGYRVEGWRSDSIVSFAPIDNGGWITFNSQQDTCMYDLCLSYTLYRATEPCTRNSGWTKEP